MNGPRFDAWTRRGLGLAAGGFAASLASLAAIGNVDGKNKKRKKKRRCKKLGTPCQPGGKRKCCGDLLCQMTAAGMGEDRFCCKREGKSCTIDADCCGGQGLACAPDQTCQSLVPSDRALKTNFGAVDPGDMVARVRALPITSWNATTDGIASRRIGPLPHEFAGMFGVGADARRMHLADGQGVALAAIQGLADLLTDLQNDNARLAARISAHERANHHLGR